MIKYFYLLLTVFLIAWAVQAYDQTTDNLLSPNFTDGSWTGTNQTSRHGDGTIAGIDGKYVESSISLNDYLTKEEINGGFSSTLGADIWFWNTTEQNVIMKQTLIDDNGVSITQQRQISGDCINYNGCSFNNYTDTIIVNGNSQQDYEITARFEFNESTGSTYHNAADLKNPSLTVSYYENFTKPDPIEFDDKWEEVIKEEYKMDYIIEEYKLDTFMFENEEEVIIFEEATENKFEKEFEEVEILQAFGGPEIVEDVQEPEDKEPNKEMSISEQSMDEEFMEEQPEQSQGTVMETVQKEPEGEQPETERVGITVQDVHTQVATKIKDVNTQLAVVNKVVQQAMTQTQPDIQTYTQQKYTDTRALYLGNDYQDLRSLDEYSKEIYTDVRGHQAMFANDPLYKYQQQLRGIR
jgi:hypothetical protein